jgi:hypothetical protein
MVRGTDHRGTEKEKDMKRTVSILTAALFVGALAIPAFAQAPAEGGAPAAPEKSMAAPEAAPAMAKKEGAATHHKAHHWHHHAKHMKHHKMMSKKAEPKAPEAAAPAAS